jgi:hypothetical protein
MITYTLEELNAVAGPKKPKQTAGVEVRDPNDYTLEELNVAAGRTGDNPSMIDEQTPKMLAAFEGQKLPMMGDADRAAWSAMNPGERALKAYESFGVPLKDMKAVRRAMETATDYYMNPPASTEQPQIREMTEADNPNAFTRAIKTGVSAFNEKPLRQSIPLLGGVVQSVDEAYVRDMDAEALKALESYDYQDNPRDKKLLAAHLARLPMKRREAAQEQFETGMNPIAAGIGGGARDVVPYILEFAITRGVATNMLEGVKAKIAAGTASDLEKRLISEAATVGLQTAINPEVPVNAMERIREGDDILNAAMKSFASTAISNASEGAGGMLDKGLSVAGQAARRIPLIDKAVQKAGKVVHGVPGGGKAGQALDKLGVQSLPSEFLEEQIDATGQAVADTDLLKQNNSTIENIVDSVMTPQEAAVTAGTLAVPGLAHGALRVGRAKKVDQAQSPESPAVESSKPADAPSIPSIDKATRVTYETEEGTVTFEPKRQEAPAVEKTKDAAAVDKSVFETPEWESKVNTALERAQKWARENEGGKEEVAEKVAEPESATASATIQANRTVEPVKETLTTEIPKVAKGAVVQENLITEPAPLNEDQERLLNEVESGWSQEKPAAKVKDPTKLIVEASRAGVALTKADVAGVMKQDPAAIAKIQIQTVERKAGTASQAKQNKALDAARKKVWQIERSRNYDGAKKELNKRISPKKRQQIESIMAADTEYQEALQKLSIEERKDTAKVLKADRTRKILKAEAGKIDKSDLAAAPLHTLPPVVKSKIQEHARYLQAQQKPGSPTHKALGLVIKDAGSDNTAAAIEQKERIIGQISGKRGVENISGKWRREEADPILSLYTSENGPQQAEEAIRSLDHGEPDMTARKLIQEVQGRIESGMTEGMPIKSDNPDAELSPDAAPAIARQWLEQVAGKSVPKAVKPKTEMKKDLLGRPIVEPIGREQKPLGFTESQGGETPIETESGKAWVTPEGKLRPETDKKAEAVIEKELTEKGQGTLGDTFDPKLDKAKKVIEAAGQGSMVGMGLNHEVVKAWGIVGADIIRKGYRTIKTFGEELVRRFGEKIRPYIKRIWEDGKRRLVRISDEAKRRDALIHGKALEIPKDREIQVPEHYKTGEMRRTVQEWMESKGLYGEYSNKLESKEGGAEPIVLVKSGIKDALGHGWGRQKIQIVGILPELIESSIPVAVRQNEKDKQITDYIYASKVHLGGETYVVGLLIHKKVGEKRRFYNHDLTEIEKVAPDLSPAAHSRITTRGGQGQNQRRPYILSIIQHFVKGKSGWTDLAEWAQGVVEDRLGSEGKAVVESDSKPTGWDQKVQAAKKRLKAFFTGPRLNTGVPLDVMHDLTVVGADLVRKGVKHAGQWSTELVKLLGTKRLVGLNLNKIYQASTIYHNDMVRVHKLKIMKTKYPELADGNGSLFDIDAITPESIFVKAEEAAGKDIGRQARDILKGIKAGDREEQKAQRQEEKVQERIDKAKKQLEYDLSLRAKQERAAQVLGQLSDELNPIGGLTAYGQDVYRVFRKVFGKHYGKARKLILAPFDQAKGAFIRDQKKWLDEVWRVIVKQYGIKAGSKESADLQRYGEGKLMTNTVKGLGFMPGTREWADLTEYGEGKVARNYLENTYGKTKAAQMIQAAQTIKDNYGEGKAGLRKMFGLALDEKYGRARADKIRAADRWFRQSYNQLLSEVNATQKQIYPNNPDKIIPAREDYYRHFQELAVGLDALKNIFDTPANISSSMALQSEYTKPRSKWLPFAQKRTGDKTTYDAVGGFLDYLKYAAYAKHIDPHIGAFRSLAKELVVQTEGTKNEGRLNVFIKYLDNTSGDLAGKSNPLLDRGIQDLLTNKEGGRRFFRGLNWTNARLKAGLILGNVGSAFSQAANIAVGSARVGPVNVVRGFGRSIAGAILGNKPMEQSNFLNERYFDGYSRFGRGILKYPKAFAKWMLTVLDEAGTKYLWNCFYEQGKRKGVSDPVAYADGMARSVVAGRGIGEVPLAQKSKIIQLVMPFQLEVSNFWLVVKDMIDERAFGQLIMLAVYDWLFNRAMEYIKGSPVLYDPIQATIDAAKEFMEEENKVRGAFKFAGREAGEFLANVPGGNIIAAVMEGKKSRYKESLFGKNTPSRFGVGLIPMLFDGYQNVEDFASEPSLEGAEKVGLDSLTIVPPFGGNQIRKTYEGMKTYLAGEERDKKGKIKWRVDQEPLDLLKSILFGKHATKGAKEYLEKRK